MKPEVEYMLDNLDVHMGGNGGMIALNTVLAIVMFGVALGIKPKTFVDIFKNPRSVLIGLTCQLILLPALTFLLTITFKNWLTPMISLGMILVASCPGGNISNFITHLSKGNTELSVSLTAINTAACVFTTPLNFAFWGNLYIRFADKRDLVLPDLQIPLSDVFVTIVIILGIPLILGILCAQYLPKFAASLKKPMQYLSIAFFIGMVVVAFGGNFDVFIKCIRYIFLVVLVHNLLALGIGFSTSTLLKTHYKDRRTITIETGIQNSGLGLALLLNPYIFDPVAWTNNGGMLIITAWWGVWHIVSGLTLAGIWRLNGRKVVDED
jgi:BASS family bile acid:Na+ symporter